MRFELSSVIKACRVRGFITVESLETEFDLSEDQACKVIKACFDKGLLLPTRQSFFTEPDEDGSPIDWRSRTSPGSANRRALWYKPELAAIREYVKEHGGVGVTINDLAEKLEIHGNRLRKALSVLVDLGELQSREAKVGGAFGRHPVIWGVTNKAIDAREQVLRQHVEEVKKQGKKVKKEKKVAPVVLSRDEQIERQLMANAEAAERRKTKTDEHGKVFVDFDE